MEVLARPNDSWSADGVQHHDSGVTSSRHFRIKSVELRDVLADGVFLEACQERVNAADVVLKEGKTGVLDWAEHIQAQKDNLSGKATVEEMKARFKKTRLRGPDDLDRYNDALTTYDDLEGSCGKVEGADSAVATSLKQCNERSKAQQPVLEATAGGMKDWKAHQKFMQRNALHQAGSPSEAQGTWLRQYRAAPKNINAFKKATANFDAPSC